MLLPAGGSSLPLWYAHYDGQPDFNDFQGFAGWSKPNRKVASPPGFPRLSPHDIVITPFLATARSNSLTKAPSAAYPTTSTGTRPPKLEHSWPMVDGSESGDARCRACRVCISHLMVRAVLAHVLNNKHAVLVALVCSWFCANRVREEFKPKC